MLCCIYSHLLVFASGTSLFVVTTLGAFSTQYFERFKRLKRAAQAESLVVMVLSTLSTSNVSKHTASLHTDKHWKLRVPDDVATSCPGDSVAALSEVSYDSSPDNIWSSRESCELRFPGISGRRLWNIIKKHYVIGTSMFKLYDDAFKYRLLTRSVLNDRDEDDSREYYGELILEKGLLDEFRSAMALIKPKESSTEDERLIIGGAHCIEALCDLFEDPETRNNPQVVSSVAGGLKALEFHPDTPVDVQRQVVVMLNEISGGGSGLNLQQVFNQRERLQERWCDHKHSANISAKKVGGPTAYEACWRDWLKTTKDPIFATRWDFFMDTATFRTQLEETGRWPDFQMLLKKVRNRNTDVTLESIVRNMTAVDLESRKKFSGSMPPARYELFWWEAIKACAPLNKKAYPESMCMFDRCGKDVNKKIALMSVGMQNGKKLEVKLPKAKAKAAKDKSTKDKASKAGIGNSKTGKTDPAKAKSDTVKQDAKTLKDLEWGDDVSWVVNQASTMLTANGETVEAAFPERVSYAFMKGLQVVWGDGKTPVEYTPTNLNYKDTEANKRNDKHEKKEKNDKSDAIRCKTWGVMKKAIVKDIAGCCKMRVLAIKEEQQQQKQKERQAQEAAGLLVEEDERPDNLEDLEISVLDFRCFTLDHRRSSALSMKDSYRSALAQVMDAFRDEDDQVDLAGCNLPTIVAKVVAVVDRYISPHWLEFVSRFLEHTQDLESWTGSGEKVAAATNAKQREELLHAHEELGPKPEFGRIPELLACFQKADSDREGDLDTDLLFKISNLRGQVTFQLLRDLTEGSGYAQGWSWIDLDKEASHLCGVRSMTILAPSF